MISNISPISSPFVSSQCHSVFAKLIQVAHKTMNVGLYGIYFVRRNHQFFRCPSSFLQQFKNKPRARGFVWIFMV